MRLPTGKMPRRAGTRICLPLKTPSGTLKQWPSASEQAAGVMAKGLTCQVLNVTSSRRVFKYCMGDKVLLRKSTGSAPLLRASVTLSKAGCKAPELHQLRRTGYIDRLS